MSEVLHMNYQCLLYDYEKEVVCQYKNETYSVRDNGSVLRHPKNDEKPRQLDNKWTFGKYNSKTGYSEIGGERVHRIVATAFHGEPSSPQHVVDHIDTNRRNNRPENLRWITKLENILLNPITVKKIEFLCGSIEKFLKDPSKLSKNNINKDFEWMRAVTKEEATITLERMSSWAKNDNHPSGGSLGEWIYRRNLPEKIISDVETSIATDKVEANIVNSTPDVDQHSAPLKTKAFKSISNPFGFPRPGDSNEIVTMYRTNAELFNLLKAQLEINRTLSVPDIIVPTAGGKIVVEESFEFTFSEIEYCYEGKSRTPKLIILHNDQEAIGFSIRREKNKNDEEMPPLNTKCNNIFEIDLSWVKEGITIEEMDYILRSDISKKKWLYHKKIIAAYEKLLQVSEPVFYADNFSNSRVVCPRFSDSVEYTQCWVCEYNLLYHNNDNCFGKSGVKTYSDLLSIANVEKEDDQITCISYLKNGEKTTTQFKKNVQIIGKTLLQLWNENNGKEIVAHKINSDWYVLLNKDPNISIFETGHLYARLGKNPRWLTSYTVREVFSFDEARWELYK